MAYVVNYIDDVNNNLYKLLSIAKKDISLGNKVAIFTKSVLKEDIKQDNIKIYSNATGVLQAMKFAIEMYAERCCIYNNLGGVYTVNPEEYNMAKKINFLDYDEALEISSCKFNSLHQDVIDYAKRHSLKLEIRAINQVDFTTIKEVLYLNEKMFVKSIVKDPGIAIITLAEVPDKKGISYNIFKSLSDNLIYVDSIMLPAANNFQQDISFSIKIDDVANAKQILTEKKEALGFSEIIINQDVAKISIIGSGMQSRPGVATEFLEILYKNDINVMMIFTTDIRISVVVEKQLSDIAINAIHKAFIE